MSNETKTLWTSKTFWGAVLGLVAYLVKSYYGYNIQDQDIQQLAELFANAAAVIGAGLVVVGRVTARQKVDVKKSISVFNIIGHLVKIWQSTQRR